MKLMKGGCAGFLVGNLANIIVCLTVVTLYLPVCRPQVDRCFLENGKAVLVKTHSFWRKYNFSCNGGYHLIGPNQPVSFCLDHLKPKCVPNACPINKCTDTAIHGPLPSNCYCKNNLKKQWKCTSEIWHAVCNCKKQSISPGYGNITYHSLSTGSGYPDGTLANYFCYSVANGHRQLQLVYAGQATCTINGWSKQVPNCVCEELSSPPMGTIIYSSSANFLRQYHHATIAKYSCSPGYQAAFTIRKCTLQGWSGIQPTCAPIATAAPSEPSKHDHKEDELIIVSATTGAIVAALILLVIIVSCQRRLHYHRLRRARLRYRQDQDAFASYITYHRNVGLMLPSYDEAVNELQHGQPPTFDEAVAIHGEQQVGTSPTTPNPDPTDSETVAVSTPSDNVALSPRTAEGRFVRAIRVLFGGRAYTTRGVYCHFVPEENEGFSNEDVSGGVERESSGPDNQTSINELNNILSRAGLC